MARVWKTRRDRRFVNRTRFTNYASKAKLFRPVRQIITATAEKKRLNIAGLNAATGQRLTLDAKLATGWTFNCLNNAIIQGFAANHRVGQEIYLTGFKLTFQVTHDGDHALNGSTVRYCVFTDNQCRGSFPTDTDVFFNGARDTRDWTSLHNNDNSHRFRFKLDRQINIVQTVGAVAPADRAYSGVGTVQHWIPLKRKVKYTIGVTAPQNDCSSANSINGLGVFLGVSPSMNDCMIVNYSLSIYYTDV
jgi:hypothetical protein